MPQSSQPFLSDIPLHGDAAAAQQTRSCGNIVDDNAWGPSEDEGGRRGEGGSVAHAEQSGSTGALRGCASEEEHRRWDGSLSSGAKGGGTERDDPQWSRRQEIAKGYGKAVKVQEALKDILNSSSRCGKGKMLSVHD